VKKDFKKDIKLNYAFSRAYRLS